MFTLLSVLALCARADVQDHRAQEHRAKAAAVVVVEMKARRDNDLIEVVAEVKNSGEKPLKNVQLIFQFQNAAGEPVSTEQMKLDEQRLGPGADSTVNVQLRDAPSATKILIGATVAGVDVNVGESGPYPIE